MSTSNSFDLTFSAGTFLPIIVIGWSGTNAVQFDTGDSLVSPITGSYNSLECNCDNGKDKIYCNYKPASITITNNSITTISDTQCTNCQSYCPAPDYTYPPYNCTYTCSAYAWNGVMSDKNTSGITNTTLQGQCVSVSKANDSSTFSKLVLDSTQIGKQGDGWDLDFNTSTPNKGDILVRYCFFSNRQVSLSDLTTLNSELSLLNNNVGHLSIPLPTKVQNYLINVSLLYGITTLFYDQIYKLVKDSSNPFISCDRLTNLSDYKNGFIQPFTTLSFKSTDFLKFPECSQDQDNYLFTLYLSYQQLKDLFNIDPIPSSNREQFIYSLANGFLRDNEGSLNSQMLSQPVFELVNNLPTNITGFIKTCTSTILSIDNDSYSIVNNSSISTEAFVIQNQTDPLTLNFLLSVPIVLRIKKWSLMLLSYFENNPNGFTYSPSMLQQISNDTYTIPLRYYDHSNQQIEKYCPNTFYFTNGPSNSTLSNLILTSETHDDCMCYTSGLSPPFIKFPNASAMCFSKYCSDDMLKKFNYQCDDISKCTDVYNWTHSSDPVNQSRNQGELNTDKFNRICGEIHPPDDKKYNYNIVFIGIFLTILITTFTFLICKNKEYSSFKVFLTSFLVFVITGTISYYLSILLHGNFQCEKKQKTPVCISKGLGKEYQIPDEFCDTSNSINCECQSNEDCGPNCICPSGNCQPKNGTRPSHVETTYKIRYIQILLCIFISFIFPLLFVYASEDYNWHVSKKVGILFVLLLSITPIVYILIKTLKKVNVTVFDPIVCN
jgi:hypothetical protein